MVRKNNENNKKKICPSMIHFKTTNKIELYLVYFTDQLKFTCLPYKFYPLTFSQ